jgi:hypothetical protein
MKIYAIHFLLANSLAAAADGLNQVKANEKLFNTAISAQRQVGCVFH